MLDLRQEFFTKRNVWECGTCALVKAGGIQPFVPIEVVRKTTGGETDKLGTLADIKLALDFESSPTHVIDFDPSVQTVNMKGRNGDFEVLPVKENGKVVNLSLSNKTLIRQLKVIDKPCRLKITRTGTSYDTKYSVEVVK